MHRRLSVAALVLVALSGCSALGELLSGVLEPKDLRRLFIDHAPTIVAGLCQTTANDGALTLRFDRDAVRSMTEGKAPMALDKVCSLIRAGDFVTARSLPSPAGPGMIEATSIKIETKGDPDAKSDLEERRANARQ